MTAAIDTQSVQIPKQYQDGVERDLIGYGRQGLKVQWPNGAYIAVAFVCNYEEGGENNLLNGDPNTEHFLNEYVQAPKDFQRNLSIETTYEYGSRAGVWRIFEQFEERKLPVTVYGVSRAMELNPWIAEYALKHDFEITLHGHRWTFYTEEKEEVERQHLEEGIEIIRKQTNGKYPKGIYVGRDSINTPRLIQENGELIYNCDSYGDDLPYYHKVPMKDGSVRPQLMIPYTMDNNDQNFNKLWGYQTAEGFFTYLKDAFDVLYEEGKTGYPKMMSIGLHCRIIGRPGRIKGLAKFMDYITSKEKVWICRRMDIAEHWLKTYPYEQ